MGKAFELNAIIKPNGPWGRTFIFNEIKSGRLIARKAGGKTVILEEDYDRYLKSLPVAKRGPNSTETA